MIKIYITIGEMSSFIIIFYLFLLHPRLLLTHGKFAYLAHGLDGGNQGGKIHLLGGLHRVVQEELVLRKFVGHVQVADYQAEFFDRVAD